LASQLDNAKKMLSARGLIDAVSHSNRDHIFGFVKIAALLSPSTHRIWGMDTAGDSRGSVRWSLDLPKTAEWHSMVHGTTNSAKAVHGINGDTHSREILVLSAATDYIDWMCIDGTNGAIISMASIPIASPILQVVPIYGVSTGGCRQAAILLHDDLTITVVPADSETTDMAKKQLQKTPNGLYTHKIDKSTNQLQTYQVAAGSESKFVARPIGSTSFSGEQIVKVAYPVRHEEIQSMSTILGDNSLLLKYINPHLAAIFTVLEDKAEPSTTSLASLVDKNTNKQPRKPAGVGTPDTPTEASEPVPNMFVNLVDTVSGRVLYRASHSNVDATKSISAVITENWVIYSFVNAKTRRTEIGVLTLHEGMIDSKGLTFFAKPEQTTSFSSFDARESTPVVLAKTYAFSKQITALGVTSTRQGISSQNILVASVDGALNSFLKKIFETRRPVGEVKPDEKKEGLVPYRELIPDSPLLSLTYNQTTGPFSRLASAETSLESQSLVLGYGGPDLFFTRTSPTKGFDLLPESFNKILVGIVTVGIVVALFVVKRMGDKQALQQSWL
jgi:ER membrane protein complex subunit 1, C-terminal